MTDIELTKRVVSSLRTKTRFGGLSAVFSLIFIAGCAPHSLSDPLAFQDTTAPRCPADSIPQCEVWGGNRFKKRYGPCRCSRTR